MSVGDDCFQFCEKLFPICRSITGNGVRETLREIGEHLPGLQFMRVSSGTKAFDWEVPLEWNVRDAYVLDPAGQKIIDFQKCNLHLVGYSEPVDKTVSLDELQQHLHSLPDQPHAIPYVTSYYQRRWGFCLSHSHRLTLERGAYRVRIDSEFTQGCLSYGQLFIPGRSQKEILLSTYICHPSMANNELSGPAVLTWLGKWLQSRDNKYSYRLVFVPETIGAIVYLSKYRESLQKNVVAGFQVTCVGDDRTYSYLPSRRGDTLADRIAVHVLRHMHPEYKSYTYLDRGSDERQWCSPGIDLPVCSIMRSKYGEYPEYHTSLDNMSLISPAGLQGSYDVLSRCIECLEANKRIAVTMPCEPQLGRRGLYPSVSTKDTAALVYKLRNVIGYADGRTLLEIADLIDVPQWELHELVDSLIAAGVLYADVLHR